MAEALTACSISVLVSAERHRAPILDDLPMPPLEGVRVLELSRVLAGPYCTMVLADLGADVIKVERPGRRRRDARLGAAVRRRRVRLLPRGEPRQAQLRDRPQDARGRGGWRCELVARADVVIENFKRGTAARMGLGRDDVAARNPRVVYCSITGLRLDRARRPGGRGYDFVAQAESGIMSITGEPDGEPMKVGVAMVDVLAGLHAAVAILAALHSGEGERIEVSLLDSALAGSSTWPRTCW